MVNKIENLKKKVETYDFRCMMKKICTLLTLVGISVAMSLFVLSAEAWTYDDPFYEEVQISVDCDHAGVVVILRVYSKNYTLLHFPVEVNMSDPHLKNAYGVYLDATTYQTSLRYVFTDITDEEARANADAVTPSMNTAFGISFTWQQTSVGQVTYTASGQSDMTSFAELLVSTCVAENVNGFSNSLPSLVARAKEPIGVSIWCWKQNGNWVTLIGTSGLLISIPPGSDSHTIDVLDLLGVSYLAPSSHSYDETKATYRATIELPIVSSNPVSFLSCEPHPILESPTPSDKGWTITETYPTYLTAEFSFGNDPSSTAPLSFTFNGTVIPEFTSSMLILTFLLSIASIAILKKKLLKNN